MSSRTSVSRQMPQMPLTGDFHVYSLPRFFPSSRPCTRRTNPSSKLSGSWGQLRKPDTTRSFFRRWSVDQGISLCRSLLGKTRLQSLTGVIDTAETGKTVTMDALSTIFLLLFMPCLLLFSFSPSLSRHVYLLRCRSSVHQSSVTTFKKYVVRVLSFLCHLNPASSPIFFVISVQYSSVVLIFRVAFLLRSRTRYVST